MTSNKSELIRLARLTYAWADWLVMLTAVGVIVLVVCGIDIATKPGDLPLGIALIASAMFGGLQMIVLGFYVQMRANEVLAQQNQAVARVGAKPVE
jgi:hypothetical protein